MNWKGTSVLVTGASGFIGSHLTEELVRRGARVTAFYRYNSKNWRGWLEQTPPDILREIHCVPGDIRDGQSVERALKNQQLVFHLAALVGIPYSYEAPESYIDTNIRGTFNVLQAARKWEISKLVHTSTSEVYGSAQFAPITEEHPLSAQSPYAASKISADQLTLSYYRSYSLPVTVVRPFNTYGPRQSSRAVIPAIASQLLQGKQVIELGNTTPTRDFTFVRDTVSGFLAAAASKLSNGEVIQIGSGWEISIANTVQLMADLLQVEVEIKQSAERTRPTGSEVERLVASVAKASRILGWRPAYSGIDGLRSGLAQTLEWLRAPGNRLDGAYRI